jgi:hypothetical protein
MSKRGVAILGIFVADLTFRAGRLEVSGAVVFLASPAASL